jgi:hypothetical protein
MKPIHILLKRDGTVILPDDETCFRDLNFFNTELDRFKDCKFATKYAILYEKIGIGLDQINDDIVRIKMIPPEGINCYRSNIKTWLFVYDHPTKPSWFSGKEYHYEDICRVSVRNFIASIPLGNLEYDVVCSSGDGKTESKAENSVCLSLNNSSTISDRWGLSYNTSSGRSITGDYGIAIAKHGKEAESKLYGISITGDEGVSKVESMGIAISGDEGKSKSGDHGISIVLNDGKATSGYDGYSVSKDNSKSLTESDGIAVTRNNGTAKSKSNGRSFSGYCSKSYSGDKGISLSEEDGTSITGKGGLAISGIRGTVSGSENGILAVKYLDVDGKCRMAVAYVGENDIKPKALYKVDCYGKFYEV